MNVINGTSNADVLTGSDAADAIYGLADDDRLNGGPENDLLDGGLGNDVLDGGSGSYITVYNSKSTSPTETYKEVYISGGVDTANYATATSAVVVNLKSGTATGGAGSDTLLNIEDLIGSQFDDVLTGDVNANNLSGGDGNDSLYGGSGDDTYVVDQVGDVVKEEANEGTDTIKASFSYTLVADVENLELTGTTSINGTGNQLNNFIYGNSGNNILDGGLGINMLMGGQGNDTYVINAATNYVAELAGDGTDLIKSAISYNLAYNDGIAYIGGILSGNVENLTLTGKAAINGTGTALNNVLTGNKASNILDGGEGDDLLIGGLGKDNLTGGLGADQFTFNAVTESGITKASRDIITDFSHSQGDKIDLSAIDANTAFTGNNAFTAPTVGGTFSGTFANPGTLYFDKTAHILYGNNDADSAADFSIQLSGVNSLAAADFML